MHACHRLAVPSLAGYMSELFANWRSQWYSLIALQCGQRTRYNIYQGISKRTSLSTNKRRYERVLQLTRTCMYTVTPKRDILCFHQRRGGLCAWLLLVFKALRRSYVEVMGLCVPEQLQEVGYYKGASPSAGEPRHPLSFAK